MGDKSRPLQEIIDMVRDIEKHFVSDKPKLGEIEFQAVARTRVTDDGKEIIGSGFQLRSPETKSQGWDWVPLGEVAEQGLANRLGIPVTYLRKCDPDLAMTNITAWQKKFETKGTTLRLAEPYGGNTQPKARALLSGIYTEVSNVPILTKIAEGFPDGRVRHFDFDDERGIFLHFTDPKRLRVLDEEFERGVHFRNSDTGYSEIEFRAMLYQLICSNGLMRVAADFGQTKRRHVGEIDVTGIVNHGLSGVKHADKIVAVIEQKDEVRWADSDSLVSYLRVGGADKTFAEAVEENLNKEVEMGWVLTGDAATSHSQRKVLPAGRARSRWNVAETITRLSQKHAPHKRFEYDLLAGKILALPDPKKKEPALLAAA